MTTPDEKSSREEAIYARVFALLKRHGFAIALIAPLLLISLVPMGSAAVPIVLVIYLGEAVVYAAIQRRRRGVRSVRGTRTDPGPGPALQVMWGCFATLLILAGLVGLSAVGQAGLVLPLIAISLGVAIVGCVWARVARASGENTVAFLGRIAGVLFRVGATGAASLVAIALSQAIGLAETVAILAGITVVVVSLIVILARTLR